MRKLGKSLIRLCVLIGVLLSMSAAVSAAGDILAQGVDGNISWRFETSEEYDGVMYFTGSGPMKDYQYGCDDPPWEKCPYLYLTKRIVIGDGITHIGNDAFSFTGSVRLAAESVYIPDTVTSIGDGAFSSCAYLREVNIPGSVRSIGTAAFLSCSRLEKLTLNTGLQTIGDSAFHSCIRMPAPVIPSSVTSIGREAFCSCSFGRIVIPASVTAIGERAFGYDGASVAPLSSFVVQGTAGSQAETYARSSGLLFMTSDASVPKPTVSAESFDLNTVKISWNSVPGAANYGVYRKDGTKLTEIARTADTSYTWSEAAANTAYTFTVRAFDAVGNPVSKYGDSVSVSTPFPAPAVSVSQTDRGVRISWTEAYLANKYRIFYRTASGSWEKLTDTGGSSYTWTGAKGGTTYSFTVRRLNYDGTYGSVMDNTGVTITVMAGSGASGGNGSDGNGTAGNTSGTSGGNSSAGNTSATKLAVPKLSKVENVKNGVKITWEKVSGAAKYRVFYKKGSGSWKKLKDTTSTSYTWKNAKSGTKYSFTVRCISRDGKSNTSSYDKTGRSITYLSAPKLSSAKKSGSGIKVSWKKVTGAKGYIVYRRTAKSGWKKLGKTTSRSYTDKKAKKGTRYYYTVRAYTGSVNSAYDTKGIAGKR